MGQRGDDLVDVVLAENDNDNGDGAPETAAGWVPRLRKRWAGRGPRMRSILTRGVVLAAVVGCAAVVVAQGAGAAREVALARLPGVVPPLERPMQVAWRMADALPLDWFGDDVLVIDAASTEVKRIDTRTGDVSWTVPTTGRCTALDEGRSGLASVYGVGQQVSGNFLGCDRGASGQADGPLAGSSPIQLIDVRDGTTHPGPELDGAFVGFGGVDGDLTVVDAAPGGEVRAQRWSPETGETVWTYASAEPVVEPPSTEGGVRTGSAFSYRGAFEIFGLRDVILDPVTGQELTHLETYFAASGLGVVAQGDVLLSDGSTLHATTDDSGAYTRTSPDGSDLPSLLGWPIPVGVDDGSEPGIALITSPYGQSSAVELSSGKVLWPMPTGSQGQVVARLGGRVVLLDSGSIQVVDLQTGDQVWFDRAGANSLPFTAGTAVTDGHSVGYVAYDGAAVAFRVADLDSGAVRSEFDLGEGEATINGTASDGTMVVLTSDSFWNGMEGKETAIVALRP